MAKTRLKVRRLLTADNFAAGIIHINQVGRHGRKVELKAPRVKIGQDALGQIKSYAFAVADDEHFNTLDTKWHFWILSNELDSFAKKEMAADKQGQGILYNADGITIWVKTWAELINECKHRLEFIRQQLDINVDGVDGLEFQRKNYPDYTRGLSKDSSNNVA
ncbi:hypothetical protein [Thalassotalea euphylliae]|uniref:Uncharacterized protein n=1 Tax=Thalassotalea euphylliae TaxID=1655234 RepID=A0A3E0U3M0_9GAMM|nr:hypothetical protein [Thalassotalea euphylliae]REL31314.1 hypothetical protein DXX94_11660 [Thalassotalea euphylliae]